MRLKNIRHLKELHYVKFNQKNNLLFISLSDISRDMINENSIVFQLNNV